MSCGKSEHWRDVLKKDPLASNLANDSHGIEEKPESDGKIESARS
jgi:hypothetical protein